MSYLDACGKYGFDPFEEASGEKLVKLAAAGMLRQIRGSKSAAAKAAAAGFPGDAAASLWVTSESAQEMAREQSWSSRFQCERSVLSLG